MREITRQKSDQTAFSKMSLSDRKSDRVRTGHKIWSDCVKTAQKPAASGQLALVRKRPKRVARYVGVGPHRPLGKTRGPVRLQTHPREGPP